MTAAREGSDPQFDMADRLRKGLRQAGVGVAEMADYLEVNRNTVGGWLSGSHKPSAPALRLWALRCGVRYEWLRNGTAAPVETGAAEGMLSRLDSNQQPSGYSTIVLGVAA